MIWVNENLNLKARFNMCWISFTGPQTRYFYKAESITWKSCLLCCNDLLLLTNPIPELKGEWQAGDDQDIEARSSAYCAPLQP